MELLLGCGNSRDKKIKLHGNETWKELVTLDHDPLCKPDVIFDLSEIGVLKPIRKKCGITAEFDEPLDEEPYRLPWDDDTFDEIHAYEVLEHIGAQGDYKTFFAQFTEFHRILKPDGLFCATVPHWQSLWVWGDPSHTRHINEGTLAFLSQKEYVKQVGKTSMSDFRRLYHADFDILHTECAGESLVFILKAVK